ncbi:MAG: M23 family metallopeptidase [Spirochaetota bacterium]|nr:M23 family metallopeptidase [Spirochaetota bacterium]
MRFMIKKYRNRISKKYSELTFVLKKRITESWNSFREKGHEKLTIMFIPHNEKRVFNFQISKFTILFFISLFLIVIITSSYAFIKNAKIKIEEQRLLADYEDIRSLCYRFELETANISEMINEIKPEVEELFKLSAGNNDVDKIWKSILSKQDDNGIKHTQVLMNDHLPEEVVILKDMQKDIACTTNAILTISHFIDERNKVMYDTPSIIPNRGHITSLFGWRRSPFGFGRNYHTGIDIAAAPGTPIRATAPGVIVFSGWGGGYGYLVRIKHKYGFQTVYGHCSSIKAKKGDKIKKGDIVSYVGQTGAATGNHCHYEIRLGGAPINPYPFMSRIW